MVDINSVMGIGAISQLVRINDSISDFMDSMPFCIVIIDETDKIIFKNSTEKSELGFDIFDACYSEHPDVLMFKFDHNDEILEEKTLNKTEKIIYLENKDMWISCSQYSTGMKSDSGKKIAVRMLRDVTDSKKTQDELIDTISRLTHLSEAGIKTIEKVVEHRDPYTAMHQKNTGEFAYNIARKLGMDEIDSQRIRYAGMVHDVGKISIPVMILNKPSRLTDFEHATIKHHVDVSYDILKGVDSEIRVAEMVLHHHERLDGTGYPSGLRGDEISQGGKILAVADILDAMTSHRPYRPRLTFDETIAYLKEGSGKLYDMRVVLAVFELFREGKLFQIKSKSTWI